MAPVGALAGGAVGLWTGAKYCKKLEGWQASNDKGAQTRHALTEPSHEYLRHALSKAATKQLLSPGEVHAVGHVMQTASNRMGSLGHAQMVMPQFRSHLAKSSSSKA